MRTDKKLESELDRLLTKEKIIVLAGYFNMLWNHRFETPYREAWDHIAGNPGLRYLFRYVMRHYPPDLTLIPQGYLNDTEAARVLSISVGALNKLARQVDLRPVKIRRKRYYNPKVLEAMVERMR